MEVLQSRTDSFKAKRVQNPTKPSSTVSVKWPHPRRFVASPAVLAEAGFYFNPSYEDRDSVTCFYCHKQLSHWEAEDDPFDIHWEKCRTTCCWAIVRCGLRGDMDSQRRFISADKYRLPTSKNMEQARFGTFQVGNGWTHDQVEDHGANSRKMARAGFIYTPQHEGDDLATCLYCEVSLGGWDAEDDPMEEHKKRGNKSGQQCAFLAMLELIASGTKPASRSLSQSKPPSKSTQSKLKYKDMVLPTKIHDGELEDDSEDAIPTAASSAKRSTRGRSTSGSTRSASGSTHSTKATTTIGKTPKKHTRSRSRGGLKDVNEDAEHVEEEREIEARCITTGAKTSRSRSKSVSRSVPGAFTEDDEEAEEVVETMTVKGRSKVKEVACIEGDGEVEEVKTLKKSTKGRPKAKIEDDGVEEVTNLRKSTRGRPKTRIASVEEEPSEQDEGKKTSRQPSRTKLKPKPEPGSERVLEGDLEETVKPPSKTRSKASVPVARKPSRTKPKPSIVERIEDVEDLPTSTILANPKKTRTASSSTKAKTRSTSKPNLNTRPVEVETVISDDTAGEPDEMDVFVSSRPSLPLQPPSPPPVPSHRQKETERERLSEHEELPPLVIPKRSAKGKGKHDSIGKQGEEGNPADSQSMAPKANKNQRNNDNVLSAAPAREGSEEMLEPQRSKKPPPKTMLSREISHQGKPPTDEVKIQKNKKPGTERKGITVVEISTDEESERNTKYEVQHERNTTNQKVEIPTPNQEEKVRRVEATTQPPKPNTPQSPPPTHTTTKLIVQEPEDVEMTGVEDELQAEDYPQQIYAEQTPAEQDQEDPPKTPSRERTNDFPSQPDPVHAPASTLIFPPLSKLPFTPIQNLSEAELNMTVEEWIRYQMEVEYDKFRRDGERELGRFKQRAEEVRGIIEAL